MLSGNATPRRRPGLRGVYHRVRLKLNTLFYELLDIKRKSGKIRPAWHHAAGVRGDGAVSLPRRAAAAVAR